jgi:hypothetical protein
MQSYSMTKRAEIIHQIRVIEELIAIAESWDVEDAVMDRLFRAL